MDINKISILPITISDSSGIQSLIKQIYKKKTFPIEHYHFYLNVSENLFKGGLSNSYFKYSIKVLYRRKIIGIMLLLEVSLYETFSVTGQNRTKIKHLKNQNGLRSDFFGVLPLYQKNGIGTKMTQYLKDNFTEINYVWGIQHESLSNVAYFLKRREVISNVKNINGAIYTLQKLN